jgi:hypothetical protein
MTTDRISPPAAPRTGSTADTLLDGLFTGMIGAITVAIWFLILDVAAGHPLYTPALLGQVLMHGPNAPATEIVIAPIPVAAYTAFHFVAFLIAGVAFAYLMNVFERFPIIFFVLLVGSTSFSSLRVRCIKKVIGPSDTPGFASDCQQFCFEMVPKIRGVLRKHDQSIEGSGPLVLYRRHCRCRF